MNKICKMMKRDSRGFTLVELMVVLVIIGILVAIAVPLFKNVQNSAKTKAINANLRTINGAISMYLAEEEEPANLTTLGGDEGLLVTKKYLQKWPTGPKIGDMNVTYSVNAIGHAESSVDPDTLEPPEEPEGT